MNDHINDYLHDYLELPVSPEYAVMIRGNWGTGKTFYIKNLCASLKEKNRKVIYVSLYGLNTIGLIDDAIFAQLHPRLSSKSAKLAGKLLTGVVKATLKIDLDGDGREGGSASLQIPEINLPEYLSNTGQHIFVFDDLERCEMSASDVIGYINYYVEHLGLKVIITANEDAITADQKSQYLAKKEKVVGCTLEIEPDFQSAISIFLSELSPKLSSVLKPFVAHLNFLFASAGYKNLRAVRQSLLGFQRIFMALSEDARASNDYIHDLLCTYMPLSFEYLAGKLTSEEIGRFLDRQATALARALDKKAEISNAEKLRCKYSELSDAVAGDQWRVFWRTYFDSGYINRIVLTELTSAHPLFLKDTTPTWMKLWWWSRQKQEDFDSLLTSVLEGIKQFEYTNIYVVLHVFGTLLDLAKNGLIRRRSAEQVLSQAKLYVKTLSKKQPLLDQNARRSDHIDTWGGHMGLGYPRDNEFFDELLKFVNQVCAAQAEERKHAQSQELLNLLANDVEEFAIAVSELNGIYQSYPAFSNIKPERFFQILSKFETPMQWFAAAHGIHDRFKYSNADAYFKLLSEIDFYRSLVALVDKLIIRTHGKTVQQGAKYFKEHGLNHAIAKLVESQALFASRSPESSSTA